MVPSLRHVPVSYWVGSIDPVCSYINGQRPIADTLDQLGYRYVFRVFQGMGHATATSIVGQAEFLDSKTITRNPAHITYVRNTDMDEPDFDIIADHAYWISDIKLRDDTQVPPIGTVDIVSGGLGKGDVLVDAVGHYVFAVEFIDFGRPEVARAPGVFFVEGEAGGGAAGAFPCGEVGGAPDLDAVFRGGAVEVIGGGAGGVVLVLKDEGVGQVDVLVLGGGLRGGGGGVVWAPDDVLGAPGVDLDDCVFVVLESLRGEPCVAGEKVVIRQHFIGDNPQVPCRPHIAGKPVVFGRAHLKIFRVCVEATSSRL
jgi:hypothetical protein